MRILITLFFACTFILTTSFWKDAEKGFIVVGSAVGFSDGTMLYLDTLAGNSFKPFDSTLIVGEKFVFKGSLKTRATRVAVRTRDISNTCHFWLENSTIYLKAVKGNFRDVIIKGSETQDDENTLNSAINSSKNNKEKKEKILNFIRSHPNSIMSPVVLHAFSPGIGKDTALVLYGRFSEEVRSSVYGKKVAEFISLSKEIKVGDKYSDFSMRDTSGNTMSLSDFKGKIILVEFWGSWCVPCRAANPGLVNIYNEFHGKGFEILGVAAESNREKWLNAIREDKLPWANVTDIDNTINLAIMIYNVKAFPTNYLIDRSGTIIEKNITGEKLEAKLRAIL